MYVCPKCEPTHPIGHGYSIAYCRDHTPTKPPILFGSREELEKWEEECDAVDRTFDHNPELIHA